MSVFRLAIGVTISIALISCGGRSGPQNSTETVKSAVAEEAQSHEPSPAKAPVDPASIRITQVRSDRLVFDPEKKETAAVSFRIDAEADVDLSIYDGRDRLVKLIEGGRLQPGEHTLSWNGLDSQGRPVPNEAYTYTVSADPRNGKRVIHDLTDLTGGEALKVEDVEWDAKAGVVRYRLDKPARVNIRFGLPDGGPYLRTLIDWVPRKAGTHAEAWDGLDASGVLPLANHPRLSTGVMAYTLPDNALLVGPAAEQVTFADLPEKGRRTRQVPAGPKRMYHHSDQPLESRGDVATSLTIDGATRKDEQGRWIVSGRVPIRLNVSNEDRHRVLTRRFEPVFFIDGIFAFENEVGFLPMTWQWDTSTVNPGEHFVTVNVRGYDGNFGTATLKVWVERAVAASVSGNRDQARE